MAALARLVKMSGNRLSGYRKGNIPSFDILLQICYALSVSPFEFLTSDAIQSLPTPGFVASDLQTVSRHKGKPITEDDIQYMRRSLETVLNAEEIGPLPNIQNVAKRIGYQPHLLQKYCPDLYKKLSRSYLRYWDGDDVRGRLRKALEDSLASDERMPLDAIARQVGCHSGVLRSYFPDLCQAVVRRYKMRFDDEQVHQRLQDILANGERAPSMQEVAREIGCRRHILMYKFPDLCQQITAKYRLAQRKRSEERVKEICLNVRQTVISLHQVGIYPSALRVTKLINNTQAVSNKVAWIDVVLGSQAFSQAL